MPPNSDESPKTSFVQRSLNRFIDLAAVGLVAATIICALAFITLVLIKGWPASGIATLVFTALLLGGPVIYRLIGRLPILFRDTSLSQDR